MHHPSLIAGLALVAALAAQAGVAIARTTADLPDEIGGKQVHAVYAVPRDGLDRRLDVDGTIAREIASFQAWLGAQTGGAPLRVDSAGKAPDITFIRLARTDAALAARGARVRDAIEAEVHSAGFDAGNKIYAVWYDGSSVYACGGGAYPPSLPGNVAAMYLRGRPPGAPPCESQPFAVAGAPPGYLQFSMLHEILHTIGIVPRCAPHEVRAGHVSDGPLDLMYAGEAPWSPSVLDIGHDDYFGARIPGCLDLATSGWLAGPALRKLRLSPRRFRAPRRVTISYTASQPVTTAFTLRRAIGRRWKRLAGSFSHVGRAGRNQFRFRGRLRGRALRPGRYKLIGTPRSSAGVTGQPRIARFRVR